MEMYEILDETFNLKNAIVEKNIRPEAVIDATVWLNKTELDIRIGENFKENLVPAEAIVFFWDYQGARPLLVRETSIQGGSIILNIDQSLLHQMQLLKLNSVRVGVAFSMENQYFCGYIRNLSAKSGELTKNDRNIGKLMSLNQEAFIAYWTEGGILSVKFRDEKKFDDEFYRAILCGYRWENQVLTAYLETPFITGEAKIRMDSMTTKAECGAAAISLEKAGSTGLKAVWKMTINLTNMSLDDSDGYCLICELGGHSFRVFLDGEVDEDDLCEITLQSGEKLKSCVIKESNGQFILKTGGIYPVMLSIVTAVYNTAPFLAEMINSVLSQDLSKFNTKDYSKDYYRDIFEFILVDDGSTDGSADILDDYAKISDKIKVIHKENGGVSSARNAGIEIARGKYITFPDSDDTISNNFLYECLSFFENHISEIDMVTTPLKFFDASSGDHWTNYKFQNKNQIIDLGSKPDAITVSVCCSVFRLNAIKQYRFNEQLVNGEDIYFIYNLFLNGKSKLGLISACSYNYRRRSVGEQSAIMSSLNDKRTYTDYLDNLALPLLLHAKEKYEVIPKYIQYTIMGQLQWKFNLNDQGKKGLGVLGNEQYEVYKQKAISLLQFIDDDVILSMKKLYSEHFYYLLKKKHHINPEIRVEKNDAYFWFGKNRILTSVGNCYIRLDFIKIEKDTLYIEGFGIRFDDNIEFVIRVNGEEVPYNFTFREGISKYSMDDMILEGREFKCQIPLTHNMFGYKIEFFDIVDGNEIKKKRFIFSKTAPLSNKYSKSYFSDGQWAIRMENKELIVYDLENPDYCIDFEKEFIEQVRDNNLQDIVNLRTIALCRLATKCKQIWLISDRANVAGDNGEAFFRYLSTIKDSSIDIYFVLDGDSPDFERMKEIGKVVSRGTKKHLLLQLMADYIISSSGDEYVFNPWENSREKAEIVKDLLCRNKFIFLQHGITINDISGWLNRYNKNIYGFVCAAEREANSIMTNNFYYNKENVWITGFPRHDRLYHDEKNQIVIMPTWRRNLSVVGSTTNELVPDFEKSEYFTFYNNLINNERLLSATDEMGYQICFMPHPSIKRKGLQYFKRDNRVTFFDFDVAYRDVFANAKLVITDYSSASLDFSILNKPVVYCQFDREKFYEGQLYQPGYFDYVNDGFGEVTYDMDSLIDVITNYMKDGCKVHEPYGSRMDEFFAFHDQNNCERVYQKIKALDN